MSLIEQGRGTYFFPDTSELDHPIFGERLYELLDSGTLSKNAIGTIVRNRYPETAQIVDHKHQIASLEYYQQPDAASLASLRQAIGLVGAFNYSRGIEIFREDGSVDRNVLPRIMLSPSAAVQVLEVAQIDNDDHVLEIFCGGGYTSLFLALQTPQTLDCVDLYTPSTHNLPKTFQTANEWIFAEVPEYLRPAITRPQFIQADSQRLSEQPQIRNAYSKIFLHPPYGQESRRVNALKNLGEEDAKNLWLDTLRCVRDINTVPFQSYSVVPTAWVESAQQSDLQDIQSKSVRETNKFALSIVKYSRR